MKKNDSNERHHFVPQFVLRNFGFGKRRPSKIHVFDKLESRSFQSNISEVASARGYNTIEGEKEDVSFEPYFTEIENKCAPIISKITNDGTIKNIDNNERYVVSLFAASLYLRGIQLRVDMKTITQKMKSVALANFGKERMNEELLNLDSDEYIKKFNLLFHLDNLEKFANAIYDKKMILFRSNRGLYISDNPITLHNENNFGPYGNIGFSVKGIQINFPISESIQIAFWCRSIIQQMIESFESVCRIKSISECHTSPLSLRYGTENVLFAQTTSGIIWNATERLANIADKNPIELSDENVKHLNYLQVSQSRRFIYSKNGQFEDAIEILRRSPELKKRSRVKV